MLHLHIKFNLMKLKYEREKHGHILANWGVIRQLVCEKHDIEQKDLDVLLYFYGTNQGYFKYADFLQYRRAFPHFRNRFKSYMDKGFFTYYRKCAPKQPAVFTMSTKGGNIIARMYMQLFGEIPIRSATEKTHMYGKALPLHESAVKAGLVAKMNEASKQLRLSPESE